MTPGMIVDVLFTLMVVILNVMVWGGALVLCTGIADIWNIRDSISRLFLLGVIAVALFMSSHSYNAVKMFIALPYKLPEKSAVNDPYGVVVELPNGQTILMESPSYIPPGTYLKTIGK